MLLKIENQIGNLNPCGPVEIAGWFISKQDIGFTHQSARQCNALLFATRQLGWIMPSTVFQTDRRQFFARLNLGVADPGKIKRDRHILERCHGRDQMERLEHDTNMAAAESGQGVFIQPGKLLAYHRYRAGAGLFQPRHYHQQR